MHKEKGFKLEVNALKNQGTKNYHRMMQENKTITNFKGLTRLNIG